jgi:ribosomal protein S17
LAPLKKIIGTVVSAGMDRTVCCSGAVGCGRVGVGARRRPWAQLSVGFPPHPPPMPFLRATTTTLAPLPYQVAVQVERLFPHTKYQKIVTHRKKFLCHDHHEICGVGDRVHIKYVGWACHPQRTPHAHALTPHPGRSIAMYCTLVTRAMPSLPLSR